MTNSDKRIPWWGMLLRTAPAEVGVVLERLRRDLVEAAVLDDSFFTDTQILAPELHAVIGGQGDWSAVFFHTRTEYVYAQFADAIRKQGIEVEVLWFTDADYVWFWNGNDWDYRDGGPARRAADVGIVFPWTV